jgi:hypothetical protein
MGITFGLGMLFAITSLPDLLVEARYSPSLSLAFNGQYLAVRNTSFEILTGVRF